MSATVGTLIADRFRIDQQVGTGGMSTVYRAFDTTLERPVAIKIMHRDVAAQSEQLERFRREARAVAKLSHPHIVGVIDAGEDDGTPFIVLEYVEGETLKDRIRRHERLDTSEAVAYAIEIARALGYAHSRGIVHRDVKPQNVLVDAEGLAKVTDFGIARTLDQEGLTADGRVLGTTDYVSPEQALGHAVTGQSDLYSLGIVLFEMLTGDVPFKGENQVAVAMKHVREEIPDVQIRRPEVSTALATAVDRATAKDLDERYADADEMIAELEDLLSIEAARSGQVTGETAAVLRTLPETSRRRLPLRMRHSAAYFVLLAVVIVGVLAIVGVFASDHAIKGSGGPIAAAPPGLIPVSLATDAAHAFDPPPGDGKEHSDTVSSILDRDRNSFWTTEGYTARTFAPKEGVGIYVTSATPIAARQMSILTQTPGWNGEVFAAADGPPSNLQGWGPAIATITAAKRSNDVPLDTAGNRFKYYLLWFTKLPPGGERISISELGLYR